MQPLYAKFSIVLAALCCCTMLVTGQIAIGTATPDPGAILTIVSTTRGVLSSLTTAQQTTLAATLTAAEAGMLVIDAGSGHLMGWSGNAFVPAGNLTAVAPLSVSATNQVSINAGTKAGDLITWDGSNWVNMQPAVEHFSIAVDNRQPYLDAELLVSRCRGIFPPAATPRPL